MELRAIRALMDYLAEMETTDETDILAERDTPVTEVCPELPETMELTEPREKPEHPPSKLDLLDDLE